MSFFALAVVVSLTAAGVAILWPLIFVSLTLALSGPLGATLDPRPRGGPSKLHMTILSGVMAAGAVIALSAIVSGAAPAEVQSVLMLDCRMQCPIPSRPSSAPTLTC